MRRLNLPLGAKMGDNFVQQFHFTVRRKFGFLDYAVKMSGYGNGLQILFMFQRGNGVVAEQNFELLRQGVCIVIEFVLD
ncbi:hypothetical protein V2J09_012791 [Rumex salicifolius]